MFDWTFDGVRAEVAYRREMMAAVAASANLHRPPRWWDQPRPGGDSEDEDPELGPELALVSQPCPA
ncbi:hypothetical protein GCM10012275_21400 [Longimycelium tulufanense]|uniref:Uncharacterized protein n=1 Tax=Longimycelium tulufanense TaxID=907463 RepID=A0A8J3CD73_9PSEU|nr:hypothetical protein [Longimycelium tulufanense]GGM50265.1 hypothetical protein GCM10012275_21400 [Longimycelium tulufanense]